jgi:hypothetical protein
MIADYLDKSYVLAQTRAQRDWLADLLAKAKAKMPAALDALAEHAVTTQQVERVIAALDASLRAASAKTLPDNPNAFIPSDPVLCGFQAGMTEMADKHANIAPAAAPAHAPASRAASRGRTAARKAIDTSATERLKRRSAAGIPSGAGREILKAPFVEGDDIHYGLDGFGAKFGALFAGRRKFNKNPARPALSGKPLRLFVFGDWGTGLPLAEQVTRRIREQIETSGETRQLHVVHLGDVYYVGEADEYRDRVLAGTLWPVRGNEKDRIGSWSLNGNHDMYAGGHGYFDKLLREGRFLRWHQDEHGQPSSFFLIEDESWQIFGLDTSWNVPSLADAVFGSPTLADYGGQNGILTQEQVDWMAARRNAAKGCVLLTHHQPASSRKHDTQHSEEAIKLLKRAGVYGQIDAWLWGHEHRCVVFKPQSKRTSARLVDAPAFCACIGHGGVPVTKKNFGTDKIADVEWQEDRLGGSSPVYEGESIVPFGFARIDTQPGALDIRIFDHDGAERYKTTFTRPGGQGTGAGSAGAAGAKSVGSKKTARAATKPTGKKRRRR